MLLTWLWLLDLLILGADVSLFLAFFAVYYQVSSKKAASGLSIQTLSLVVSARVLHLLSHPMDLHFDPTMLPMFLYAVFDLLNAGFAVFVLYYVVANHLNSYEADKDTFGEGIMRKILPSVPSSGVGRVVARAGFSYAVALALGVVWWVIRRSRQPFWTSYFACVYEVLGAISLLPQLWMFQKDRVASPQLANFVVLMAINRLCTLGFWTVYPWIYHWRYPDNRGIQMLSEVINLLIISDFLFYYVKAKIRGERYVKIPAGFQEVV